MLACWGAESFGSGKGFRSESRVEVLTVKKLWWDFQDDNLQHWDDTSKNQMQQNVAVSFPEGSLTTSITSTQLLRNPTLRSM
eukprot:3407971-Amphidinium_carterae.1